MPKKATQKTENAEPRKNKKAAPVAEPEADVAAEAEAEAAPVTKPAKSQAAKSRAPAKKGGKKEAVASSASTAESTATSDSTATPKTRHVPTRESVENEFDELVASIDEEINKLRSSTAKAKGVKFLRTVNKRVKTLRNHSLRVSKQRQTTRRSNTNSGFLKPVQISKDLAKFTGWDQSQLRSRVDVTKFICDYIKEHDLQDPEDKRNIRVDSDANLKKLLKFDGKDGKKLTYYSLQTYLKGHFSAPPAAESAAAAQAPKDAQAGKETAHASKDAPTQAPKKGKASQ
jgi:chromatin remodeling complex protein RSC6